MDQNYNENRTAVSASTGNSSHGQSQYGARAACGTARELHGNSIETGTEVNTEPRIAAKTIMAYEPVARPESIWPESIRWRPELRGTGQYGYNQNQYGNQVSWTEPVMEVRLMVLLVAQHRSLQSCVARRLLSAGDCLQRFSF